MRLAGIIFDKDGTLFDFQASWGAWTHGLVGRLAGPSPARQARLAEALGFDMEARAFRADSFVIAGSAADMIAGVSAALPDLAREVILREVIDGAGAAPQAPVAGLEPALAGLRSAGLRLGVATNDAEAPAVQHLEGAGIDGFFDFVAGSDSGFGAKPAPGMLLGFCAALGLRPETVAMVGDSTHDLHAARAAGMLRIGVLTGVADRAALEPHADLVFDSIAALPDWLASRNATSLSQTTMP
ncbi:MAG: HAD family hydrolase [Pseudomonadota bacterium]